MELTKLRINSNRLETMIHELGHYGLNEKGGLDRTTFTESELAARNWLKKQLGLLNLSIRVDPAANIWATRKGRESELPVISFGSHIDTVPNGGKYDGALGVLIALEIMKTLEENGYETRHPFELVSFSAEEPNPFGLSTFGSRAVTGKLKKEDIKNVKNSKGECLIDALVRAGGSVDLFEETIRHPSELAAFLEVHIEQGKRLLNRMIPVGIVTSITGIYREEITIYGQANHAGTTLMKDRKDALAAASELILALEEICYQHPSNEVVGTIGKLQVFPNAPNIIPEEVICVLEIRGKSQEEIKEVINNLNLRFQQMCNYRSIQLKRKVILNQDPAPMNNTVVNIMEQQANSLGYSNYLLGSMAGHDATHMASITKSGMLFVPSIDGKSHCPEEESRIEDIEKVANVLLHSLLKLDEELDK